MKLWLIILIGVALILVVAGAGYLGTRSVAGAEDEAPQAPVTVAATLGEVQQTVAAPGQVVGVQERVLGLKVSGQLVELEVRPGQLVRAGEVLARLDPEPLEAALTEARLRLSQAEADHKHDLAESRLNLRIAEAHLKQAEAKFPAITAAEADLKAAQAKLQQLLAGPEADEIIVAAAELRQSEVALKEAQGAYDQIAYADTVGASPEALKLQEATLDYEARLAAYNLATQGANAAEVAEGEAEVQRAQVEVAAKQAELAAHQQEMAALEAGMQQARLKLEQLGAGIDPLLAQAVAEAERDLANAVLTAPFEGVVLEVLAKPGETVTPEKGVLLLADPTAVEVQVKVIEEDLPLVEVGQPAELFFDAEPEGAVQGSVSRIVPQRIAGEDRPLYYVYLSLDRLPQGVVPGMTADASIIIAQKTEVVRLPRALARPNAQGTATIKVWANNRVEEREVRVGLRGDVYVEVVEGLAAGEEVVGE